MAWQTSVKAEARITAGFEFVVYWLLPFVSTYWAAVGTVLLGVPLTPELVTTVSAVLLGGGFHLSHGPRAPPALLTWLITATYALAALSWVTGAAFLAVVFVVLGLVGHALFDQRTLAKQRASEILRDAQGHPLDLDVSNIDRLVYANSNAVPQPVGIGGEGSILALADKKNFLSAESKANMARLMRINPNILLITDGSVEIPGISPQRVLVIPEAFNVSGKLAPSVGRTGVYLERVLQLETIKTIWNQGAISFYHTSNIELLLPAGADPRLLTAVKSAWILLDMFKTMIPASKVRWNEINKVLRNVTHSA